MEIPRHLAELKSQGCIDFDDMIIRANNAVNSKAYVPNWKYILVDEFQDISMSRMRMLQGFISQGDNPSLTVVGDDWQSIYRFTGGKLELTTRFSELVGSNSTTTLQKTYRYNNSIAAVAGSFIMENPEQIVKDIKTESVVDKPQVYLLDSFVGEVGNSLEERVRQIIQTIKKRDKNANVAILARYHYLLENVREHIKGKEGFDSLKFWTFHGSKGLEADYCILIGFSQGRTGFPNENKEEAVLEALLPSLDSFKYSEERRLLYVALTRAKYKSYLIADPMAPSEFINELIAPKYKDDIKIASQTFEERVREIYKCPHCEHGYFKQRKGKFGPFYSCTTGIVCKSNPEYARSAMRLQLMVGRKHM